MVLWRLLGVQHAALPQCLPAGRLGARGRAGSRRPLLLPCCRSRRPPLAVRHPHPITTGRSKQEAGEGQGAARGGVRRRGGGDSDPDYEAVGCPPACLPPPACLDADCWSRGAGLLVQSRAPAPVPSAPQFEYRPRLQQVAPRRPFALAPAATPAAGAAAGAGPHPWDSGEPGEASLADSGSLPLVRLTLPRVRGAGQVRCGWVDGCLGRSCCRAVLGCALCPPACPADDAVLPS